MYISIHAPAGGATWRKTRRSALRQFQFTPLREGRQAEHPECRQLFLFQFTPLREGRPNMLCAYLAWMATFQFTPLREGRPPRSAASTAASYFNSRPCGRGDSAPPVRGNCCANFNSRPCGRGDQGAGRQPAAGRDISIHAPAGGATAFVQARCLSINISIHAPAGGATRGPAWRTL